MSCSKLVILSTKSLKVSTLACRSLGLHLRKPFRSHVRRVQTQSLTSSCLIIVRIPPIHPFTPGIGSPSRPFSASSKPPTTANLTVDVEFPIVSIGERWFGSDLKRMVRPCKGQWGSAQEVWWVNLMLTCPVVMIEGDSAAARCIRLKVLYDLHFAQHINICTSTNIRSVEVASLICGNLQQSRGKLFMYTRRVEATVIVSVDYVRWQARPARQ